MQTTNEPVTEQKPTKKGIVYLSRLPYGFDDKAAFSFFPQFGEIKGICFPRSKKTGRSKGYMFILFEDEEVAKVAVKTLDKYAMMGKQLKAQLVESKPGSAMLQKFKTFYTKFKFVPWKLLFRKRFNTAQSEEAMRKKMQKLLDQDEKKRKKLKDLGITFEFPGYAGLL